MSSLTTPVAHPVARENWVRRWLVPSVPELLFFAIVAWLIGYTATADMTGMGLLRDSQTGYHIRTGEFVMTHGTVPMRDFLSFTKPGEAFYAWEWLAGVGSALLFQWGGLSAIVVASALILALTLLIMMRHMAERLANVVACVFLIHLAIGASSIHYLARPHIFTLLFMACALWTIDRDREKTTPWLWTLVPLTALWANLHGGFFGLLVSGGVLTAGCLTEWLFAGQGREAALRRSIRWGALTAACFAASLVNPYGINEHIHLVQFMRETWYLGLTEEYYAPTFTNAAGAYYGVLLASGIAVAMRLLWRRQIAFGLLILAWSYASSRSVRHVPIYAIVVLPWIAAESAEWWRRWTAGQSARTLAGTLEKMARDYQPSLMRSGLFVPLAAIVMLASSRSIELVADFPDPVYPVAMVNRHAGEIRAARVFSPDGWGHYLTYKFPEPFRIYVDGRTDFFGESFSREYVNTMNGIAGWDRTLNRYGVNMALIPPDIKLAERLAKDPSWQMVEHTDSSVLFRRKESGVFMQQGPKE